MERRLWLAAVTDSACSTLWKAAIVQTSVRYERVETSRCSVDVSSCVCGTGWLWSDAMSVGPGAA